MRKAAYILLSASVALTVFLLIVWLLGYGFGVPAIINQFYFWVAASMVACLGIFLGIVLLMIGSMKK
jgi:hypothetical protein